MAEIKNNKSLTTAQFQEMEMKELTMMTTKRAQQMKIQKEEVE